jgi:hypothetical protein
MSSLSAVEKADLYPLAAEAMIDSLYDGASAVSHQ